MEGNDTSMEGRDTSMEGRDTSMEGRDTSMEGKDTSMGGFHQWNHQGKHQSPMEELRREDRISVNQSINHIIESTNLEYRKLMAKLRDNKSHRTQYKRSGRVSDVLPDVNV